MALVQTVIDGQLPLIPEAGGYYDPASIGLGGLGTEIPKIVAPYTSEAPIGRGYAFPGDVPGGAAQPYNDGYPGEVRYWLANQSLDPAYQQNVTPDTFSVNGDIYNFGHGLGAGPLPGSADNTPLGNQPNVRIVNGQFYYEDFLLPGQGPPAAAPPPPAPPPTPPTAPAAPSAPPPPPPLPALSGSPDTIAVTTEMLMQNQGNSAIGPFLSPVWAEVNKIDTTPSMQTPGTRSAEFLDAFHIGLHVSNIAWALEHGALGAGPDDVAGLSSVDMATAASFTVANPTDGMAFLAGLGALPASDTTALHGVLTAFEGSNPFLAHALDELNASAAMFKHDSILASLSTGVDGGPTLATAYQALVSHDMAIPGL